MKIADLRHVIYLQTPTTSQTARGAETISWGNSPALRAKVTTASGDERKTNEQVIAVAAHLVELRWPLPTGTTATTKSRVKWTQDGVNRYFGISAIGEPDNRRRRIVLSCQELVGEDRGL
jgi:head-tail adaptor